MSKQLAVAELPAGVRGPFEGVFTQVRRAEDGKVYWRTTCSDDGVDKWATRMTVDLHEDFIRNAEGLSGMPYLTIAHYNELARIGRATKLYRDGRRLKAEGMFWTDHEDEFTRALATKAADAALDEANLMPRLRRIRTSIGFHPTAAEQEDLGVMAYTRGVLPEIAMTTSPGNSRVDFDAGRSDDMQTRALKPEFMREDASSIVGEEMAEELDRRLKAVIGDARSDPNADTLELLYRSATEAKMVAVSHEDGAVGRAEETREWDGAAVLEQVGATISGPELRGYFAVINPDGEMSTDSARFLHHDFDTKGMFLSLAGLVAAGAAAVGSRTEPPNLEAQKHLEPHYAEFHRTAPWKRDRANMAHRLEDIDDLRILQRSGLVEEAAVERAIGDFGENYWAGMFKDATIEDAQAHAVEGGWEFRTGTLEPVSIALAPLLARVGRRLQGKRLSEMENAIKALSAIVEWAKKEEEGEGEGRTYEEVVVDPNHPFRAALEERLVRHPGSHSQKVHGGGGGAGGRMTRAAVKGLRKEHKSVSQAFFSARDAGKRGLAKALNKERNKIDRAIGRLESGARSFQLRAEPSVGDLLDQLSRTVSEIAKVAKDDSLSDAEAASRVEAFGDKIDSLLEDIQTAIDEAEAATEERAGWDGTDPDQGLIDAINEKAAREMVFNATFTLADIVCANFEHDTDDDLSLEGRLTNIQNASNEYLSVINSMLMSAFGSGRSAPNDNRDEMKPQESRTDVKPDVQAPGGVKDAGGSDAKPDLQRFEQTVEQLRQHIIDSDPAKVQEALNELVPAIEQTMGPEVGGNTEEMDAILARVAGTEIGISAIQGQLTELLDRMDERSTDAVTRTDYNPPVPRRRGYAPGPPPSTVRSDDERWDGKTPLKIRDVARQSVGLNRYP